MTRLESGNMWHALSNELIAKYHGGQFQLHHRNGFNTDLLTQDELNKYVMVYTATMQARGIDKTFEMFKRDILKK